MNENGGQRDADEGKFDPAYIPYYLVEMYVKDKNYLPIYERCLIIRKQDYEYYSEFETFLKEIIEMCLKRTGIPEGLSHLAQFLEVASKKYNFENFKLLNSENDFFRFRRSLCRHAFKCVMMLNDEPHNEAIIFNATMLLVNFTKEQVNKYRNEPEKYALKGKTDITVFENSISEEN